MQQGVGRLGGRVWGASAFVLLLYLLVAATTLGHVGLSGDSVSGWATAEPHRTVLCVTASAPPRLRLAARPTEDDRAQIAARLESSQRDLELGPIAVRLREHTYSAVIDGFGVEIPWMKNDYTAGWTDLPAHVAWSLFGSPRAGQAVHLALGGLVLVLVALLAGRLGGWPAALVAGSWLATDPWFLVYKRFVGGHEVFLQVFAVAGLALLCRAALRRERRAAWAGVFVLGLGLATKPSFAAVLVSVALAAGLVLWRWSPPGGWRRALAVGVALLGLGASPTALSWVAGTLAPPTEHQTGGKESSRGRLASLAKGWDRGRDDVKSRTTAVDVLLWPGRYWERHWTISGSLADRAAPSAGPRDRSWLERASTPLMVLLLLGGLAGAAGLAQRTVSSPALSAERLGSGAVLIAGVLPFLLRALNPDPHHLALWVPAAALGIGVGVGGLVADRRALAGLLLVLALLIPGRVLTLRGVDEDVVSRVGRLSAAEGQRDLAEELARRGITAPAVLDFNMMSVLDAWSGGAVRPWLYSRASLGQGQECLRGDQPAFLRQILRAHAGGHVVIVAGPNSGPGGRPDPYRSRAAMQEGARAAGVTLHELVSLDDPRGRWMATVWSVDAPPRAATPASLR